jgi:hypothetical protein
MRTSRYIAMLMVSSALLTGFTHGQELLYDQMSGPDTLIAFGLGAVDNRLTQSFTPQLGSIGFVQLQAVVSPGGGSSLSRLDLRSGGLNGPLVASTETLMTEDNSLAVRTYYFQENIPVTPGQTYWLDITLVSLEWPAANMSFQYLYPSTYQGGDLYANEFRNPDFDFWFREGTTVPEPSAVSVVLCGAIVLHWCRFCRGAKRLFSGDSEPKRGAANGGIAVLRRTGRAWPALPDRER